MSARGPLRATACWAAQQLALQDEVPCTTRSLCWVPPCGASCRYSSTSAGCQLFPVFMCARGPPDLQHRPEHPGPHPPAPPLFCPAAGTWACRVAVPTLRPRALTTAARVSGAPCCVPPAAQPAAGPLCAGPRLADVCAERRRRCGCQRQHHWTGQQEAAGLRQHPLAAGLTGRWTAGSRSGALPACPRLTPPTVAAVQ